MHELINLDEVERAALARLSAGPRDYYAGGAADELTLRANRAAWERLELHYRVLRDVSRREQRTTVLGTALEWPLLIAPTAYHQMAHADGELATARAAAACGTALVLSTLSNYPMEQVARAAGCGWWFQLYVYKDRGITRDLVARAIAAGCGAIAVTVDAPVGARRERDVRNAFAFPANLPMSNLLPAGERYAKPELAQGGFMGYVNDMLDASLSWRDLDGLVAASSVPVLVKGVVRADDALTALDHGARGIIVSNHGGRQLDTAPATATVLPEIAAAIAGRATVLVDGGIRRGTDILKALALGADAVLVGRPALWGLTVGGEAGVRHVLNLLRAEFDIAMALAGCESLAAVTPDLVRGA
ncbi:MAG TPA: alpha-hydroxy acid oxidase [Steroidobacteraceae bacterium]|nr:alpha-hydroxy acid oxidase [Steroidobacteraceae bacterium]HRX89062.1 alpha-hydroxy acid oxidase [Steroidobacteraceae bacterium]